MSTTEMTKPEITKTYALAYNGLVLGWNAVAKGLADNSEPG